MRLRIRHAALWSVMLSLADPLGQTLKSATPSELEYRLPEREYRLRFYHTHTNERLEIVYRRGQTTCLGHWPNSTIISVTIVRESNGISTPIFSIS